MADLSPVAEPEGGENVELSPPGTWNLPNDENVSEDEYEDHGEEVSFANEGDISAESGGLLHAKDRKREAELLVQTQAGKLEILRRQLASVQKHEAHKASKMQELIALQQTKVDKAEAKAKWIRDTATELEWLTYRNSLKRYKDYKRKEKKAMQIFEEKRNEVAMQKEETEILKAIKKKREEKEHKAARQHVEEMKRRDIAKVQALEAERQARAAAVQAKRAQLKADQEQLAQSMELERKETVRQMREELNPKARHAKVEEERQRKAAEAHAARQQDKELLAEERKLNEAEEAKRLSGKRAASPRTSPRASSPAPSAAANARRAKSELELDLKRLEGAERYEAKVQHAFESEQQALDKLNQLQAVEQELQAELAARQASLEASTSKIKEMTLVTPEDDDAAKAAKKKEIERMRQAKKRLLEFEKKRQEIQADKSASADSEKGAWVWENGKQIWKKNESQPRPATPTRTSSRPSTPTRASINYPIPKASPQKDPPKGPAFGSSSRREPTPTRNADVPGPGAFDPKMSTNSGKGPSFAPQQRGRSPNRFSSGGSNGSAAARAPSPTTTPRSSVTGLKPKTPRASSPDPFGTGKWDSGESSSRAARGTSPSGRPSSRGTSPARPAGSPAFGSSTPRPLATPTPTKKAAATPGAARTPRLTPEVHNHVPSPALRTLGTPTASFKAFKAASEKMGTTASLNRSVVNPPRPAPFGSTALRNCAVGSPSSPARGEDSTPPPPSMLADAASSPDMMQPAESPAVVATEMLGEETDAVEMEVEDVAPDDAPRSGQDQSASPVTPLNPEPERSEQVGSSLLAGSSPAREATPSPPVPSPPVASVPRPDDSSTAFMMDGRAWQTTAAVNEASGKGLDAPEEPQAGPVSTSIADNGNSQPADSPASTGLAEDIHEEEDFHDVPMMPATTARDWSDTGVWGSTSNTLEHPDDTPMDAFPAAQAFPPASWGAPSIPGTHYTAASHFSEDEAAPGSPGSAPEVAPVAEERLEEPTEVLLGLAAEPEQASPVRDELPGVEAEQASLSAAAPAPEQTAGEAEPAGPEARGSGQPEQGHQEEAPDAQQSPSEPAPGQAGSPVAPMVSPEELDPSTDPEPAASGSGPDTFCRPPDIRTSLPAIRTSLAPDGLRGGAAASPNGVSSSGARSGSGDPGSAHRRTRSEVMDMDPSKVDEMVDADPLLSPLGEVVVRGRTTSFDSADLLEGGNRLCLMVSPAPPPPEAKGWGSEVLRRKSITQAKELIGTALGTQYEQEEFDVHHETGEIQFRDQSLAEELGEEDASMICRVVGEVGEEEIVHDDADADHTQDHTFEFGENGAGGHTDNEFGYFPPEHKVSEESSVPPGPEMVFDYGQSLEEADILNDPLVQDLMGSNGIEDVSS